MRDNRDMNVAAETSARAACAPALPWQQPFADLGAEFSVPTLPQPLPQPYWVAHCQEVATLLDLPSDWQQDARWLHGFSGNAQLAVRAPVASVYSGHQFGVWAGQLGDGRALTLGECAGLEIQLKGAGPTPYSRRGDGRAVLRSSIREFLCGEAMHALGIASTRALCVTGSDYPVQRESLETAAVLTRVAPSFIRFGHFEHFSQSPDALRTLADYVLDRYYPECRVTGGRDGESYAELLAAVARRTAHTVAQWQAVGFCHGVMNTDNMSILGLTLDYGPFQFMDAFDPSHICNHSDTQGRYAFGNQPQIAYWNLFCLGQAMLPLIRNTERALAALETYKPAFSLAFENAMARKLGCEQASPEMLTLLQRLLPLLAANRVDYTLFWRRLSHWAGNQDSGDASVLDLFLDRDAAASCLEGFVQLHGGTDRSALRARMLAVNPKFVLRNHLGESAIRAAREKDFSLVGNLLKVLQSPFDEHAQWQSFADFPPEWARSIEISCSS